MGEINAIEPPNIETANTFQNQMLETSSKNVLLLSVIIPYLFLSVCLFMYLFIQFIPNPSCRGRLRVACLHACIGHSKANTS